MMLNRKYYQVSEPEMEFHMIDNNVLGFAHALSYIKDDIFMQRRLGQIFTYILKWGQMTCKKSIPYPARAYTTLVVLVSFN